MLNERLDIEIVVFVILLHLPGLAGANELHDFAAFGFESVKIGKDAIVTSGSVGANGRIEINKDSHLQADVLGNDVILEKKVQIDGNVNSNFLSRDKGVVIQGVESGHLTLPIVSAPDVSPFPVGDNNVIIPPNSSLTINSGDYRIIKVGKNSHVVFSGGTYNIQSILLEKKSRITFGSATTMNIALRLRIDKDCLLSGGVVGSSDVFINYAGEEDINVGTNTVLHANVIAPYSSLTLGKYGEYRGTFAARQMTIEKGATLGTQEAFTQPIDRDSVLTDIDGSRFPPNQVVIALTKDATREDANAIASAAGGRIVGFIPGVNTYQLDVATTTAEQLNTVINELKGLGNVKVRFVSRNYLMNLDERAFISA